MMKKLMSVDRLENGKWLTIEGRRLKKAFILETTTNGIGALTKNKSKASGNTKI